MYPCSLATANRVTCAGKTVSAEICVPALGTHATLIDGSESEEVLLASMCIRVAFE